MKDEVVANFYNICDAFFPASNIIDLTEGIYSRSETTFEDAQLNQLNWLLDRVKCGRGSRLLDIGSGYGTLLREAQKRRAFPLGISLSKKQIEFCRKAGYDVNLLNYKDIDHLWNGSFDCIAANGSLEHFVKPEEAEMADNIYRNFFNICHRLMNPLSSSRMLATTAIHHGRFKYRNPLDLTKSPFRFTWFSEDFHAAIVQRAMACLAPQPGQLEACAKPYFKLVEEVDGTEDYRKTSEEWLLRVKESFLNPKKLPGILSRLAPFLIRHPLQTLTAISFVVTESWNKMFRGDDPPMRLYRHVWKYQEYQG